MLPSKGIANVNYYAFTARPKAKTIELFGHLPNPELPAYKQNKPEAFLSQIPARLTEVFITGNLTNKDMVNYAYTTRDKLAENSAVIMQIATNICD